jgi:hypothetical protein
MRGVQGQERDALLEKIEAFDPDYSRKVDLDDESWASNYPSVDHQSCDPQIFDDRMMRLLQNDRIVILGGNDNDDQHPNEVYGAQEIISLGSTGYLRLRQDGDYLVLFDPNKGTKGRVSLDNNAPDYVKSTTPELVDLKITDWCDAGCKFCYQSSTLAGKHAPIERIERHIDMLAEMEVFEVAIGGGEPTSHPEFARILHYAKSKNVIPNFTTLSNKWLANEDIVKAVCETVGGIGVSCSNPKSLALVEEIKTKLMDNRGWGVSVMAQHVVGAQPLRVTADFMNAAMEKHIPVLLLGYKTVGFGGNYTRHDVDDADVFLQLALKDYAKESRRTLSVDTSLLDQYPSMLQAIGAPASLASSPEGKFSCYIDAVANTMGASSYVELDTMTPVPDSVEGFKEAYAVY